jgi:N-acetylmuramoyl-L-alanine amidase
LLVTPRTFVQTAILVFAASAATAQAPAAPATTPVATPKPRVRTKSFEAPSTNFNLVVLDPGHGGPDKGATFPNNVLESAVTLALANRLRPLLAAQGFSVVLTRENNTEDVPEDARVALANRTHAGTCLLLHAANGGHGIHLYTSALTPATFASGQNDESIQPWDSAQAGELTQSAHLLADLQGGLGGLRVHMVTGRASVAPVDSLTCPTVAVEIAPLAISDRATTPVDDPGYQQHLAEAVTTALVAWRNHAQAAASQVAAKKAAGSDSSRNAQGAGKGNPAKPAGDASAPKPKTRPKAILVPGDGSLPPAVAPARKSPAVVRQQPVSAARSGGSPPA